MCDPCCGVSCSPFCDPCEQMTKPRELKGGIYTKCDCTYRNGLQDSCLREDCKRPKRERHIKHTENSFDIERTISHMTQPQTIQMPQHMTKYNGLSDYTNQTGGGGMPQLMGLNSSYFSPQSYPISQQLNLNSLSPQQFTTQEPQSFMQSQSYGGVPENSVYSPLPNTDGATLSPAGMTTMGLGNMYSMGGVMNAGGGGGGGMQTLASYNGMGGNMSGMGNMGGMASLGGMNGMAGLGNMGGMAGMGGSGGMSNFGGGMGGGMSGGATYQSYPQMSGFGDGQAQTMSQCY